MLTDHASRVLAVATRLTAETGCVCDIAQPRAELIGFQDSFANQIGYRNLGGRDEIVVRFGSQFEQILFKLGQLARTEQCIGIHNVGYVKLCVAVLADLHLQHEVDQCAVQPRDVALQHDEAAPGEAGPRLEIEPSQRLADRYVVPRRKLKGRRLPPAEHLFVIAFIHTLRHAFRRQIGHFEHQCFQRFSGMSRPLCHGVDLCRNAVQRVVHLLLGLVHRQAALDQFANFSRCGLALRQQILALDVCRLALGIQRFETCDIELESAPFEFCSYLCGILPHQFDVQHRLKNSPLNRVQMRRMNDAPPQAASRQASRLTII